MTAIAKTGNGVPSLPAYREAERLIAKLRAAREAVALAREPTPDLLKQLDEAAALALAGEVVLKRAATPGKVLGIGNYLAQLLEAYPNSGSGNAETFGGLLVDDVMELEPPIAAVEIACRRWRQRSKFPPAISELLEEVKAAKLEIASAAEFIVKLPSVRARAAKDLGLG